MPRTLLPTYSKLAAGMYLDPITPAGIACTPEQLRDRITECADHTGPDYPALTFLYCLDIWNEYEFPTELVRLCKSMGVRPFVIMMALMPPDQPMPGHRLEEIAQGSLDHRWVQWGRDCKACDWPLFTSFSWEANTGWLWSGLQAGGFQLVQVGGEPGLYPLGPWNYRQAASRAQDIINAESGGLVTWVLEGAPNIWGYGPGNDLKWYRTGRESAAACILCGLKPMGGEYFADLIGPVEEQLAPLTGLAKFMEIVLAEVENQPDFKAQFFRDLRTYLAAYHPDHLFWRDGGGLWYFDNQYPLVAAGPSAPLLPQPVPVRSYPASALPASGNPFALNSSPQSLAAYRELVRQSWLFTSHFQEWP